VTIKTEHVIMRTLIVLAFGIVSGLACFYSAKEKKRDPGGWFILGFLFPLIALIIISILPK